jgi:adenylate kinase
MGPPGVGKGTQAVRLKSLLGVPHVSTGDILRAAMQDGSALGRQVRGYVESGQLVPDELVGDLIAERLQRRDAAAGFVLDGFPPHARSGGHPERCAGPVGYAADEGHPPRGTAGEIVRRLSGRRTCPKCGAVYHLESHPRSHRGVCDACGAALVQRPDDMEDVIRERLKVYGRADGAGRGRLPRPGAPDGDRRDGGGRRGGSRIEATLGRGVTGVSG